MALTLDLTRFRAIADSALPDTATVSRPSRVADTSGGSTTTWATVGTYACRYAPTLRSPIESQGTVQIQSVRDWVFTFSATLATDAIRPADRFGVGSRTFEVISGGAKSYEVARTVVAREVK